MVDFIFVRRIIYENKLIDKSFFNEKNNEEFIKDIKHAKKIFIRENKKWGKIPYNTLKKFFKNKKIKSSGVVAVLHKLKNSRYTQYCSTMVYKTKNGNFKEVDIEFHIYWKPNFSVKK